MTVDAKELQGRWRAVAKHFPLWRFAFDVFFDLNSWRMIGADITTMMVESKHVRRAAHAMEDATPETLDALAMMARVNEARANDLFRAIFLGYVSVPIALAALLSDAAPQALGDFVRDYATSIVILLIGALLFPIVYFCGHWRAKQIAWTIELYRAGAVAPLSERGRR